jgi:hypothetical protein
MANEQDKQTKNTSFGTGNQSTDFSKTDQNKTTDFGGTETGSTAEVEILRISEVQNLRPRVTRVRRARPARRITNPARPI